MEKDIIESNNQAFVGVAFHSKVIFNVVDNDGGFMSTGLSIIQHIKTNKNKFVAKIVESQSYNSIKYILDDKICFSDFYDLNNENKESFVDILRLINDTSAYHYFYVLDLDSNTLIIKIPSY